MLRIFLFCLSITNMLCYADNGQGKVKASSCSVCHGQNGLSKMAEAPNLAGQSQIYLIEQLKNYRNGKRQHEVMSLMAKPLSDPDIEDISQWFSSMEIQVTLPK